ncbi:hypothetical protein Pan153_18090 [Gimesia panareensis]|uniref:Uncharacterized protein n=1 Tax=Gimesia panareensis TaxID=2527978 RepID=A0A518FLD9_9PLAN|nr:DUF6386 family protein [Gimesia panareensis]QDV17174.1 hypothetical protein Pan153_18090 [Gimesia panareensis]
MSNVEFVTDTAMFCVFDLASLRHRIDDDCDWWSVPDEELIELNAGNVAFIGLGEDGKYSLDLSESPDDVDCTLNLKCPSGRIFLGAGEEVTGEGLEPEAIRGGTFLTVVPGNYRLLITRKSERAIAVRLQATEGSGDNQFACPIRI